MTILQKVDVLMELYHTGQLGGEIMPEDENPHLNKGSMENYIYFTLPMSLNYQRNSYKLWESANRSYHDCETRDIFSTYDVAQMDIDELRKKLIRHKLALQPNKQPVIWSTICVSINELLNGDIRNLFIDNQYSILKIKQFIMTNKKSFPYLSGNKILNYWLYVMRSYTDMEFTDNENLTIAPDTHVIQASVQLGVITYDESQKSDVQIITAQRWHDILAHSKYDPIDLHTPLWLWSHKKCYPRI